LSATPWASRLRPGSAIRSDNQLRPGQNVTVNGKFYTGIDGYMIAGPMFSNFMCQIAPGYGTDPFPEPPSNLLYGTPQFQHRSGHPSQGGNNTGGNTDTGNPVAPGAREQRK
jgi:hypothetical protein